MNISKFNTGFLKLVIICLGIAPAFALGEGNRNLLLIGLMFIPPIIILFGPRRIYTRDLWLISFVTTIIFFPLIFNPESMRWSTVLYSVMFCFTFMAYSRLLFHSNFRCENYQKLLRNLICAYFIVLLVQQFCVLTGLPIFNISNYDPNEIWKLNSLAAEPSHSARIVALLMFCYISSKELILLREYNLKLDFKNDRWVWIAFIWTMVTMGSATAFLFIAFVFLKFMRIKNLFPLLILFGILFILINFIEVSGGIDRTYKTFLATLTLNENTIIHTDHSASIRIVPFIILIKMVALNSWEDFFGHGIDHVSTFLSDYIPGVPEGISGGGLLQVWIEYGFISFAIFVVFSLCNSFRKGDYLSLVFWFMLVFMYGINNQIVWLCIILLYTNKIFSKKQTENLENTYAHP